LDKKNAAIPNKIIISIAGGVKNFTYSLDNEDVTRREYDIFAILVDKVNGLDSKDIFAVNEYSSNIEPRIMQDVFIIGYPLGINVEGYPIWKRGTIASEPTLKAYLNKENFLVDASVREGMSGSPVFATLTPGMGDARDWWLKYGCYRRFLGIYSGRLKIKKEEDSQLGIVWKEELIEKILASDDRK